MRMIRTIVLLLLAAVLVVLALANRQPVTLSLQFTDYLPGLRVTLPLFLVLIITLALGVTIGLVWEWLRAAPKRAESARRAHEISVLEREVRGLRKSHAAPADEVEAILDAPRRPRPERAAASGATASPPALPALPARGG